MGRYEGSPVSCIRKDIRPSARTTVQGKPAARRGRKARDLIETARPPVQERTDPLEGETNREGEPGALHLGSHASCIDGPHRRRRDSVGLVTMKTIFKAQTIRVILALMTLASSALVIQAGHRWT